jgi:hypothetical protein
LGATFVYAVKNRGPRRLSPVPPILSRKLVAEAGIWFFSFWETVGIRSARA